MARKRDLGELFEILGDRRGGRRSGGRSSPKSKKGAEVSTPWELGRGVFDWARSLLPGNGKSSGARRPARAGKRRGATQPLAVGGPALVGIVVLALGLGYVGGRVSAGGDDGSQLRSTLPEVGGRDGPSSQRPEWLQNAGQPAGVQITAQEETEKLWNFGYRLVPYPALERQRASELARWLRGRGLTTARLRLMEHAASKQEFWVVVCYVRTADDPSVYNALQRLTSDSGTPAALRTKIKKLLPKPREFS